MKYSEFRVEVEKLGLHLGVYESYVYVVDKHGDTVSCVGKEVTMGIDTDYEDFRNLPQEQRAAVFEALYKLAKTPLAEREEEKRYYLRLATKIDVYEDRRYLNMDIPNEKYTLSENKDDAYYKTIFTESEIAQMDTAGFEKVEVSE